jgi:hypothetical protein
VLYSALHVIGRRIQRLFADPPHHRTDGFVGLPRSIPAKRLADVLLVPTPWLRCGHCCPLVRGRIRRWRTSRRRVSWKAYPRVLPAGGAIVEAPPLPPLFGTTAQGHIAAARNGADVQCGTGMAVVAAGDAAAVIAALAAAGEMRR